MRNYKKTIDTGTSLAYHLENNSFEEEKEMSVEEIFKTMQDLIVEQFAIDAEEVTQNTSFEDDLGADSVDLVELVMAMEEEFEIEEIQEEELLTLKTVGDCVRYLNTRLNG